MADYVTTQGKLASNRYAGIDISANAGLSEEEIKAKVIEIQKSIDVMNDEIAELDVTKNELKSDYDTKKEIYEKAKDEYIEKSSTGKCFLIVTIVAFVIAAALTLNNTVEDFFMLPATCLLVVAIVLRYIGVSKFKSLKQAMLQKDNDNTEAKKAYDEFMTSYKEKELALEKKQYEWELVENDRIQAKITEWEATHKVTATE